MTARPFSTSANRWRGPSLLVLVALAVRLLAPLWHVVSVEHRACGEHLVHIEIPAAVEPVEDGSADQQRWVPARSPSKPHSCWVETLQVSPEGLLSCTPARLVPLHGAGLSRPLDQWELIWAATRFGLAPCLSPPA